MMRNTVLESALIRLGSDVYACYLLADTEVMNWLHQGISHECSSVFLYTKSGPLKPFATRCGINVATHIDATTEQFYHLVSVPTTCVWCTAGVTYVRGT